MEKYILKNNIEAVIKENNNTPRSAVVLYAELNKDEEKAGINFLMTELMLQGTTSRNSEELADEIDENAIDIAVDKRPDCIRLKLLCLNEDIECGLEILSDIMLNSTFNDYKKETAKIKGEFEAELDSPKTQAQDEYYRTIFKNHQYGARRKEIIESIDLITKDDLISAYNDFKYVLKKNISYAGSIPPEKVKELFEKYFKELKQKQTNDARAKSAGLEEDRISLIQKEDANQAQIFQGWNIPDIYSNDYPAIIFLSTLLGASGLSSRLFMELREKQGLAYTVRSSFEAYVSGGHFYVYIATEPKNIKTALQGFKAEMKKIMNEYVSDEELQNTKNNAVGRRRFYKETNLLEADLNGFYECLNLGCKFEDELINKIESLTKEDILKTASKYFSKPSALCILAPKKSLSDAGLL